MPDILLAIGVPFLAGLLLTVWRSIATRKKLKLEATRDVALDMIFLAIGSAGGIFKDAKVEALLREYTTATLLILILFDLLTASILLYLRRFHPKVPKSDKWRACMHIAFGATALMLVAGVVYRAGIQR